MKTFQIQCDGYAVDADWHQGERTDEILLSLIGWTSSRKRYTDILSAIVEKTGMSALVFDYSGHGDNKFDIAQTTQAQHLGEALKVYDWLRSNHPTAKITVMGSSYGGFLAAHLIEYRDVARLVLRVPAIYNPADFHKPYGEITIDQTSKYRKDEQLLRHDPLLLGVKTFAGRSLVVVHGDDEQVPTQTTAAYIAALGADVYVADGFPHSLLSVPKDKIAVYEQRISDWLNATRIN